MSIRVLFLATYFPRPTNLRMGTWSLDHAVALRATGLDVTVVSLTPMFPHCLARVWPAVATYTLCPRATMISDVPVLYPLWLCYPIKQTWRLLGRAPSIFLRIGWVSAKSQVLKIIDEVQPDVILANHSLVNGYVALKLKQLRGLPYITVDHEIGDFLGCRDNPRWLSVLQPVIRAAACSVTVSKCMQTIAQANIPDGRFQTIYNGAGFEPCESKILERHRDKPDVRIFCCGNLYGRKDIPLLVRAFVAISREFPKATLRIAGDGPDRESISQLVASLPCRDRIHLLGSIEHSAVQEEMRAADIFALVGWAEPFGVVFLEAMANGCPVIVSSDAGVAEILTDGETAVLTKPRDLNSVVDALASLCRSAEKRDLISRAGHELYKESCQWKHRSLEYLRVLKSALNASQT